MVLTRRERVVLLLVAAGRTDKEIARVLGISGFTASTHVRNIREKLGVNNRTEAAIRGISRGLVHLKEMTE